MVASDGADPGPLCDDGTDTGLSDTIEPVRLADRHREGQMEMAAEKGNK